MDSETINTERHSIEIATDILSIWGRWPYYRLATADGQMLDAVQRYLGAGMDPAPCAAYHKGGTS